MGCFSRVTAGNLIIDLTVVVDSSLHGALLSMEVNTLVLVLWSLDAWMESYVVQLDFSAAFDRVSHSSLLFKLVTLPLLGGSVLSICREFSNRRKSHG